MGSERTPLYPTLNSKEFWDQIGPKREGGRREPTDRYEEKFLGKEVKLELVSNLTPKQKIVAENLKGKTSLQRTTEGRELSHGNLF